MSATPPIATKFCSAAKLRDVQARLMRRSKTGSLSDRATEGVSGKIAAD